ncbi:MAG: putative OB-fold protein contains Zn-ribbon domain, partial [Solirubrobacterales bacterium]|nr:putative OB-fold protein contains Zn-ribbon domain [Solirubrobacterales bacterium]
TVLTWTRDYVYPGGDATEMAVIDLDDGARFYGQVAMGETAPIGTRVRLVPRRLHAGGGIVQYFWKAVPCP